MKRVAVLFTCSPWLGSDTLAGIDAALAVLAFEHELVAAFAGDGVALLCGSDDGGERAQRQRMVAALHHHGATALLASADCLAARSLQPQVQALELLPLAAIGRRIAGADHVLCF
jgi:sulfur relay (sulfurtransferase) DsrF/TusC family protein